ncbi:MAG: hypothetical protein C0501_21440 [Isosphaera sp.]|nr:hypothetical protein [Isosphaera sp.]
MEISRRHGGGFQLDVLRWTEEWVPGFGKVGEFREPASRTATFTDTLERAEELAEEKFRSHGTTGPVAADE